MKKYVKLPVLLVLAGGLFSGCALNSKSEEVAPAKLHMSDGRVFLEKSDHSLVNERRGTASEKWNSFVYFSPSQNTIPGQVWASETGPYEVSPGGETGCEIKTSKSHYEKAKPGESPTILVQVKVIDGLKEGPFDTVINGESEGELQFGQYPLKDWKAIENLTLDETFIKEWSYSKKEKLYKIVKKMGEDQYLKKEIRVGHQVRGIASVKYEILQALPGEEKTEFVPLARLSCGEL